MHAANSLPNRLLFVLVLASAIAVVALGYIQAPGTNAVIIDDFNDNSIDSSLWTASTNGTGVTLAETNQRLEVSIEATAAGSVTFGIRGQVVSNCLLSGDFDIRVQYSLLTWPTATPSGVRVSLVVGGQFVHRGSFSGFPISGEAYATELTGGVPLFPTVATSDTSGTLRLVRSGSNVTGYYFDGSSFQQIGTTVFGPTIALPPELWIWSQDAFFTHQAVLAAFDNFEVFSGTFTCPTTATPTSTATSTPTDTPTPTATATITETPTPTSTSTNTPTPTVTNTPTSTSTIAPTPTVTNTPTNTSTPTNTPTSTNTPTVSSTPTNTNTPTVTNTPTMSRTPTATQTPQATSTPSPTGTAAPQEPVQNTPTPTSTPTRTPTASPAATSTPSAQPAAGVEAAGVTPPQTGDAGLSDGNTASSRLAVLIVVAAGLGSLIALRRRRA